MGPPRFEKVRWPFLVKNLGAVVSEFERARVSGWICGMGPPRFEKVRWLFLVKDLGIMLGPALWELERDREGGDSPAALRFSTGFWSAGALGDVCSWDGGSRDGVGEGDSPSESRVRAWDLRRLESCSSSESVSGVWEARVWADVPSPGSRGRDSGFVALVPPPWRVTR